MLIYITQLISISEINIKELAKQIDSEKQNALIKIK